MKELSAAEIECVSGGCLISGISAYVGNAVVDIDKLMNDFLNTSVVSSVGQLFNAVGLGSIHYAADSLGYAVFRVIGAVGSLLGGDVSRIDYHFEHEWGA